MGNAGPFFIVGCPRSGTTLLTTILRGHSAFAVPPHETAVLRKFLPSDRSEDPTVDVDGFLRSSGIRELEVSRADLPDDAATAARSRLSLLFGSVMDAYARRHGKPRWGEKTPGHLGHMEWLAHHFPDARFIHIIRDGREVAASMTEMPWGPNTILHAAYEWRARLWAGRAQGVKLRKRYTEIRLEDLVARPEEEVRRLTSFLGADHEPALLNYRERAEEARLIADPETKLAVRHLDRPPTAGLRNWREGASRREQAAVEAICRPLLRELGYPTDGWSASGYLAVGWLRAMYRLGLLDRRLEETLEWRRRKSEERPAR